MNTIKPIAWKMEIPETPDADFEVAADAMRRYLGKHVDTSKGQGLEFSEFKSDEGRFIVARLTERGPKPGPELSDDTE